MKKILILLLFVLLVSCKSSLIGFALKKAGATNKVASVNKISHPDKEILFLGMIHIGQKEFYEDVKRKVDSLTSLDYHVFYEGSVLKRSDRVIKENDTVVYLKFRKLLGLDPLIEYTKVKPFSNFVDKYSLVNQPDYVELGLNTSNSTSVELTARKQIELFENAQGEIILDECDQNTKLGDPNYNCEKLPKEKQTYFIEEIVINKRNQNIYENIKASEHDKILIIYGKKHLKGIRQIYISEEI